VERRRAVGVTDRGELEWGVWDRGSEPLPEEWVLRQLADVDLEDDEAIISLLDGYGVIYRPFFDQGLVPQHRQRLLGTAHHNVTTDQTYGATVEDARWWLKTARALAGVWSAESLGDDPTTAWLDEGFTMLNTRDLCWSHFAAALNKGLEPFRARVEISAHGGVHGRPRVDLYAAACRQIFNLAVQGETARRCENQTCGRPFLRQIGGPEHRLHYRSDARYCTDRCARAEASRQYRRRRAAQKKGGK